MIKPGKIFRIIKGCLNLWTVAAGVFAVDQLFKEMIDEEPEENFPRELEGSKGKIYLHHNRNKGFSYGFLGKKRGIIHHVTYSVTSAVTGIFFYLQLIGSSFLSRFGFALLAGGAISNLCDRMRKGYVVDYFSINLKGIRKTVFNIGDFAIMGGTMLAGIAILLDGLREKRINTEK